MHRAGLLSSVTRGGPSPPPQENLLSFSETEPVTSANIATRRLWLGLKYWNNAPVMSVVQSISKPRRPVIATVFELERLARGFQAGHNEGLTVGELLFLTTDKGVLEVREAIEKRTGGLLLCRVKP
jgi:small subunit ribosomal protein S8